MTGWLQIVWHPSESVIGIQTQVEAESQGYFIMVRCMGEGVPCKWFVYRLLGDNNVFTDDSNDV